MPSISVESKDYLYVNPITFDTEASRFEAQCRIILGWQSSKLSAYTLLGLTTGCSKQAYKKSIMYFYIHFHPDKNPEQSTIAAEAFKVLKNAANYVDFYEYNQQQTSLIKNNPFAKPQVEEKESAKEKSRTPSPVVSSEPYMLTPEQQAYIQRLKAVDESKQMTREDEQFFKEKLVSQPELLVVKISKKGPTLFATAISRGATEEFFKWLMDRPYAEEVILETVYDDLYDCFTLTILDERYDCAKILHNLYGNVGFQNSQSDNILFLIPQSTASPLKLLTFLFTELGYIPKPSTDLGCILVNIFRYVGQDFNAERDVALLKAMYRLFKDCGFTDRINYQSLLNAAIQVKNLAILKALHEEGLINRNSITTVFASTSFFKIWHEKHDPIFHIDSTDSILAFMQQAGYQKVFYLEDAQHLKKLHQLHLISLDEILQTYPLISQIWLNKEFMDYILAQDKAKVQHWYDTKIQKHYSYDPKIPFSEKDYHILRLTLAYDNPKEFSPRQLDCIAAEFNCIFENLTQWTLKASFDEKLELLMDVLIKHHHIEALNKRYETAVQFPNRGLNSVISLPSFTPLEFFMALRKESLVLKLLKADGVNCKQLVYFKAVRYFLKDFSLNNQREESDECMSLADFAKFLDLTEAAKVLNPVPIPTKSNDAKSEPTKITAPVMALTLILCILISIILIALSIVPWYICVTGACLFVGAAGLMGDYYDSSCKPSPSPTANSLPNIRRESENDLGAAEPKGLKPAPSSKPEPHVFYPPLHGRHGDKNYEEKQSTTFSVTIHPKA